MVGEREGKGRYRSSDLLYLCSLEALISPERRIRRVGLGLYEMILKEDTRNSGIRRAKRPVSGRDVRSLDAI